MRLKTTKVFNRIVKNSKNRLQILQGGTSSSKTYSTLQWLIATALQQPRPKIYSIVSETMPHLKRGAMRDLFIILGPIYTPKLHNKSEHIYQLNNTKIEFFSADQESKLRGSRRDWLFINEANNVKKDAFDQLEVRTREKVFIDFNPTQHFWGHDLQSEPLTSFDISTYKDNSYLEQSIVNSIERRRFTDPNWWRVYGEGLTGNVEGLVYPDFKQIDALPEGKHVTYGLDFGYTNDPTTLLRVARDGEALYIDQLIYETGMRNEMIIERLRKIGIGRTELIYADSAEPKSIDTIKLAGFNIKPCIKGKDSVKVGIDYINNYRKYVTKRSVETIKEFRNYSFMKDKDGRLLSEPNDSWNHSMDAFRYSQNDKIKKPQVARAARARY